MTDVGSIRGSAGVAQLVARIPGGEIVLSSLPPGAVTHAHHHAEAQLDIPIAGAIEAHAAGAVHVAGGRGATLLPPHVVHGLRNQGATTGQSVSLKLLVDDVPVGRTPLRVSTSRDDAGRDVVQFGLPTATARHRWVAPGTALTLPREPDAVAYVATVPGGGAPGARILQLTGPLTVDGRDEGCHVVEVRLRHRTGAMARGARLEWRSEPTRGTVLVVDASDATRRSLAAQFARAGYAAVVASSGCEALERAAEHCPEIVVLDLDLPDCAGGDLLAYLHAQLPLTKLVALTATGAIAAAAGVIRRGAASYLPKPTSYEFVLDSLRQGAPRQPSRPFTLQRATWEYIQQAVHTAGSLSEAARRLGVQPRSLRRMLAKNAPLG
jgi:two-component system, response regulator RegA